MISFLSILNQIIKKKLYIFFLIIFFSLNAFATNNELEYFINGNKNTDKDVILSIIENVPDDLSDEYSNYLLKELNSSGLFKDISISIDDNKYYINVVEYPTIKKIYYDGNERLKDEQLDEIASELNLVILNEDKLDQYINELKNIYYSFGYNNININYSSDTNNQNLSTVYFDIKENKITKIKKIKFNGNSKINEDELRVTIKSRVKTLQNIFANNNFKPAQIETDKQRLKKLYRERGFADINIDYEIEFFDKNFVIIYFNINEGKIYEINDTSYTYKTNNENINKLLNDYFSNSDYNSKTYNSEIADQIEKELASILKTSGIQFFEIKKLVNLKENKADLRFEIFDTKPVYVNNININGNTRTFDYVIRRELNINEGDAFLNHDIKNVSKKIQSLGFFEDVNVSHNTIDDNLVDIDIDVKENQTGSFTAGASFGTLDGIVLVTGLKEKNFGGTGRGLEFTINNSENNNEFSFETTDSFFLNKDLDLKFGLSYKERDLSKSSSYQIESYQITSGLSYKFIDQLYHSINLNYEIDDIYVTDSSTVSSAISNAEGGSVKFKLSNELTYSNLNSYFFPKNGNMLNYANVIETPSSSKNGFIKNTVTFKKFKEINKDIISFQARIGNIFSLNNSDILPNNKYSLGGRWLRGFDIYGAGPRNSRTSYVGGNNIIATKIDYSKLLLRNDDNPIYFNLFNDAGIVWDNKTEPTFMDESIRSSAGFGFKFYSFIGPIAFTWGFPIADESYDIKRMFTFSIGNIN
tara:strand:- start:1749 stop:4019 length:2271 start_codon:yes stop_codon:yes gene_type:complete